MAETLTQEMVPWVLTVDIGSSSVRVVVYDVRGRAVPGLQAQVPTQIKVEPDGTAEIDPNELLEAVARCIDDVLARAGDQASLIGAVASDTLATTLMAVDEQGQPLTALMTYADTRGLADVQTLRATLEEAIVHDRTGCLLRADYWPARLTWLQRTQPELWRKEPRWISLGEYLEQQWFGRCRFSLSAASWTGLLNRHTLNWDASLLEHLGVQKTQLSDLVDVDEPLSGLQAPWAKRWPNLSNIPWFPAIADGAAANVGSGCLGPDRIALTLGTTGALRLAQADVPQVPAGLWCYRIDRRHALLGCATSEGGNVYAWLRQMFQEGEPDALEAALAAYPPDGHGLTLLPFVAGERGPGRAGYPSATVHGLTLATTPIAILRAGMEAVAFRFAAIWSMLPPANLVHQRVIASGNALRSSSAWAQIFADVLGWPIVLSGEGEATSRGAAVLALRALGHPADPATDGPTFLPDEVNHQRYQTAIARQQELYKLLAPSVLSL